jgi:hypothetical protein
VYAARVIVRAWLRCRDMKRFRALKEAWELEQSNDIIEDIIDEVLFTNFIKHTFINMDIEIYSLGL